MHFSKKVRRLALGATALAGVGALAAPASAVVINDNYNPSQIVDPTNITGVGQMVTDEGGGYVGLCTATLINPRTVILAAHCVNDLPASAYGSASGGQAIGVGFQADNLPSILDWFGSGFQSNPGDYYYNGSYVVYNQHSLDLGPSNNYLQADVAMIAFDTPVTGVPTMDLLLSPLDGPTHATIEGYGGHGTGSTGSDGSNIDFRRRVAENTISVLGSIDDFYKALGASAQGLPQNLYQNDFNDPNYGKPNANPGDFDIFGDAALDKEGITAPGDSGGPLVVDQKFSKPIVAAVLSGGFTFVGQNQSGYGTTSFYQPLYLYWDWIVANNPYKYVSAKAGNGSWTDPKHWQMDLDPIYQVIGADGQLTNGLPGTPAAGINGTSPKFGYICDGVTCTDIATGKQYPQGPDGKPQTSSGTSSLPGSTAVATNDKGSGQLKASGAVAASDPAIVSINGTAASPQAAAAPPQTDPVGDPPPEGSAMVGGELVQGAPGSSDFVPNDTDGDPSANKPARYYDVTLSADGTTTLSGAQIIIDRLTLSGTKSGLTIDTDAALASLIDTTLNAGVMTVNGAYVSVGDFKLNGGLLQGSGLVRVPYLTSLLGAIAPGGLGTIGTLTIQGNAVLSSGSRLYVDLGPNGTSDVLAIEANPLLGNAADNGKASLGGLLALGSADGYRPTYNDQFTVVTASGGLSDRFDAVTGFSGVLYPVLTQSADAVKIRIAARPYASVINQASGIQRAYAQLLDQSRANSYAALKPFYYQTDVLDQGPLQTTLEAAGPYPQQTERQLARMQDEALASFYRDRLSLLRSGEAPETLAVIGHPLGVIRTGYESQADVAMGLMQANPEAQSTNVKLPEGVSAYVAGGYLDGRSRPLPNLITGRKDDLSGWYVAAGIEKMLDDATSVGVSVNYSHGTGDAFNGESARSNLFQLALYGTERFGGGAFLSANVMGGILQTHTHRHFTLNTATADLRNEEDSPVYSGELTLGYDLGAGALKVTPMVGVRSSHLEFDGGTEYGGLGSLTYGKRSFNSIEGRAGAQISGDWGMVRPHVEASFVHDFLDREDGILAYFTGATGPGATFAYFPTMPRDHNWGEVSGGFTIGGRTVDIGFSASTVVGRKDLSYQTYRGSLTFHF